MFTLLLLATLTLFRGDMPDFEYTRTVEHLFTHCLIAYPSVAFSSDNPMKDDYNKDCITTNEFKKILNSLYKNNYCIVDINSVYKEKDGTIVKNSVKVPVGKKALVLSFDDVNYDHKKNGVWKGTINVTGYDGVLGYRTQSKNKKNREQEIEKAKVVIKKLKNSGWNFASHSYGHYHMKKLNDIEFLEEVNLWKTEVEPLVGKTGIYVYPYGEWEVFDNLGNISKKHQYLIDAGFKVFCGVGMKTFYDYLPNKNKNKVLFMDRKVVDGNTLRKKDTNLYPFFDPSNVYDYAVRPSV